MKQFFADVWAALNTEAPIVWAWLKTVNWARWWPAPAIALALTLGYCAHTVPPPVRLSPPPPVPCNCPAQAAKPALAPVVSKPALPLPPVKRALSCADVPPAAYRAPRDTVLAEAKRRGYGPITRGRLVACLEKHHG